MRLAFVVGLCALRTFASQVATTVEEKKVRVRRPCYFFPQYVCLLVTLGDLEQVAWSFLAPTIFITYLFHSLAIRFRRLIFGLFFFCHLQIYHKAHYN